jgi:hypothetical protein
LNRVGHFVELRALALIRFGWHRKTPRLVRGSGVVCGGERGSYLLGPQIVNLLALFTDPSRNAVTNPNDVSMFTEIIAESLENMALAISLTWAREVIVFILFLG